MKGNEGVKEAGRGEGNLTPSKQAREGDQEGRWGNKQSVKGMAGEVIPINKFPIGSMVPSYYHLPSNIPNTPGEGIQSVVSPYIITGNLADGEVSGQKIPMVSQGYHP